MKKLLVLLCICFGAMQLVAQNRTVTGKITDDKDVPLAGVTVRALSTNQYTVTKADGTFSLSSPSTVSQLEVSSVGFASQTLSVRGLNSILRSYDL
jgi:hypothetical protein